MIATFFGGAIRDTTTPEYSDSVLIGKLLATNGFSIKNGGYFGLMEAVSMGASTVSGIEITGYTCLTFPSIDGNSYLTSTVVCNDIYERLKCLISDSSVFIIQKGGIGTLSELFLLLDVNRKKKIKPKIYLFGDDYKNLLNSVRHLISDKDWDALVFCDNYLDFEPKFISK